MILSNKEIYNYATQLVSFFQDTTQRLPIKVNFYLQKNKNTLINLAQDIEEARINIVQTYGEPLEDGSYNVPRENIEIASKELNDLFSLEQEVTIYKVNIENFPDDIVLTTRQMEGLMFMIE